MGKVILIIYALVVVLFILMGLGFYEGTADIGDFIIGVATLILALVTYLTGKSSELVSIEVRRLRQERLNRLLDLAKDIQRTETDSIAPSLSNGNLPQPQYNQLDDLNRTLDSSDNKDFRDLVWKALIEMQFDLENQGQRIIHASRAEDLYKEVQKKIPKMRDKWQEQYRRL